MKTKKAGFLATIAAFILLLIVAGAGFEKTGAGERGMKTTENLNGKTLAGITGMRLSEESAEVFFETLYGISLAGYHAADTIPELLYDLRSNRADAIWVPDVTARYLLHAAENEDLARLSTPEDTAGSAEDGGRFELALALRPEAETLCTELSAAIMEMKSDKTMEKLAVAYVEADSPMDFYEKAKGTGKVFYVGVTGTLPPIDRYDRNGVPCGFSAAFLSELSNRTGYRFVMVKVTPENAFTELAAKKIDLLLAFGTGKTTTPGKKDYITTRGYYTIQEYACLSVK